MFAVVTVITELIVTVFGKTDQLVRNLIFMYTSNNCSDTGKEAQDSASSHWYLCLQVCFALTPSKLSQARYYSCHIYYF